jgi:hypothetical protein
VVRELDSQSKGYGFESRFIQNTKWKWGQGHAGINFCNLFSFSLKFQKNIGSQMGHTDKKTAQQQQEPQ